MIPYFHRARFLISAAKLSQLPDCEESCEVAFAGRSNAGKSSAINTLTHQKALARTSKTPGRTQLINLFALDDHRRLVDLPGYGFAKVAAPIRDQWRGLLSTYIEERRCLKGVVVMMDVRHPLKELDEQMIAWCNHIGLPVHVLLTKADKLKRGPATASLHKVRKSLSATPQNSVQLFSSLKKTGIDEAHEKLAGWLNLHRND
ncbi:MAG: ribosome biogenesis GTP-binding protein YihA/YsxC [Sedimenticolaceae bacterium]|nr:ribosome biogenesis GTP-binding protein YihA/YsxC [Sedimenticolaceae bacterium]